MRRTYSVEESNTTNGQLLKVTKEIKRNARNSVINCNGEVIEGKKMWLKNSNRPAAAATTIVADTTEPNRKDSSINKITIVLLSVHLSLCPLFSITSFSIARSFFSLV